MNFLPSRKSLRKYLFEIIVIFIGITLGFLFDEWRDSRLEEKERTELRQAMRTELIRIKTFFLSEDASIQDQLVEIKDYLTYNRSDTSALYLLHDLTREVSFLQGTFSHVNALAKSNASRIAPNLIIAQNLSFIGNMENDLARMKGDTRQIILGPLWQMIVKCQIDQDILVLMNENKVQLRGNYKTLLEGNLIDSDLRFLSIKLTSLTGLNKSLIGRIDDILGELDEIH